ncbi:MAG: aromatic ring-hydroxylating dioxygenase subunit alpha [Fuerstia sp.]|nr:aromatic ring-hydroxylating dioxygenase subunit alpha [Fuerstiella sp.]
MFVHQGKLDPLLRPEDYCAEESFSRERRDMFSRQWNIVGLAESLSRAGDYIAVEVQGVPVIVHHSDGTINAFRNSCAHRHSMLRPHGTGNQPRLTCQYHGWQYQNDGKVTRVPDGQSFKGIKADQFCLAQVRSEVCGPFVLVCLDDHAASFRSHLGDLASEFDTSFGHHRHFGTWKTTHAVNWKIIVENAVESYHVPLVHPTTFQNYRAEELHDHRLAPNWSRYADLQPWDQSIVSRGFRFLARTLLKHPTGERFKHTHIYPNHLLYYGDLMSTWTVVEPVSALSSNYTLYAFVPEEIRKAPGKRILQSGSATVLLKQLKRILREDMELWPKVQGGLAGSVHSGVLSCREERIWAFQEFVHKSLSSP